MNRHYALNFTMTLLPCAVLFCVPFVVASLPSPNDIYILTLDASDFSSCNTRTLWDILLSCWLTLFACTWTAIHPDIPRMGEGKVAITFRRLLLMVMALLGPEFVISWAAWQFLCARQVTKDFNDAFGAQHAKPHGDHRAVQQNEPAILLLDDISDSSKISSAGWTLTHGFFAWMGGFMLYVDGKPRATLTPDELLQFVREGSVEMPVITEADIEDRSKGDVLSKSVAILQLVWFIIARYAQHLPVTLPEIDTLGIAALTCIAYGLWWKKPKDVGRPYIVHWNSGTTTPPPRDSLANDKGHSALLILRSLLLDHRSGIRWSSGLTRGQIIITIIGGISGVLFGGIHCLGWNFLFPIHTEQTLWRVASIAIAYSFGVILSSYFMERLSIRFMRRRSVESQRYGIFTLMIYYISARLTLIVLMMLSLRSLPPGAYDTVAWTSFFPHANL
ncbi:uncharacterized protein BJ212DRAFT_348306 [Suillus subaureus]|uniref:Uncharacterized protein n=1 Tax=Suillus subaureus TaxID=48587 RepID=A0A9P7E907_9AGAM|nr:uncharacterized protein BJ212DRAFT_348306 [Suillus subaureus]KAG1814706.1 hypothetical protein BJ212DRAFT_348306 [Suillus subaureus]